MKGVVLAGGTGSRLRPITYSMAKQLIPVANVPIIFYGLNDLASAGIRDVAIIVSPESNREIRYAVGDGSRFGIAITYIVQDRPLGLAHALKTALPFVGGDDVLMYLGDNLVKGGVADVVREFLERRPTAQILLQRVSNPSSFGVVELDDGGRVVKLVEKPQEPRSDLALVGVYLFDSSIGAAIDAIRPSARGEYEITEAIQYLVDHGHSVRASLVREWWKDTGKKSDLLHANELLLEDLIDHIDGTLTSTTASGPIRVGRGSTIEGCDLSGPVVIGQDVHLNRTTVGPNTSIGSGVRMVDVSIEDSIVLEGAKINGWRIRRSLIGRRSVLDGAAPSRVAELTVGELTQIEFE
jgi:glucose-1-phosphate thymidylyltransferase